MRRIGISHSLSRTDGTTEVYDPRPRLSMRWSNIVDVMTPDQRERALRFYLVLAHPTRIGVIDVIKAAAEGCTERHLAHHLVEWGDMAPQAAPNLRRVHLQELVDAELLARHLSEDGDVVYDEGPLLAGGIHWTAVDRGDEELKGAAREFERVLVERRIHRQRWWASHRWTDVTETWSAAAIGRDNVVRATKEDLHRLDEKLVAVMAEWDAEVRQRRLEGDVSDEVPCFRTIAVFPLGSH